MKTVLLAIIAVLTPNYREAAFDACDAIERASHLHLQDRRLFVQSKTEYEKYMQKADRLAQTKDDNQIQVKLLLYSVTVEACDSIARTNDDKKFSNCTKEESEHLKSLHAALKESSVTTPVTTGPKRP